MAHSLFLRRQWLVIFALVSLLFSGSTATTTAGMQTDVPAPLQIRLSVDPGAPGSLILNGSGFTAEGNIFVGVYDVWGVQVYETRWITGSASSYAELHGQRFSPGGAFTETFEGLCGNGMMVRAYDQQTAAWSDFVSIDPNLLQCKDWPDKARSGDPY